MPPVILPRSEHPVSRKNIDPDALKVLYRLKSAGHIAYLVGGSVRDLLLDRQPKDFDISTSGLPNEVRRLFRNCRLIGRRFRLAHIVFGRDKVIEVATFRRKSEDLTAAEGDLLVRRDNTFGSPEEDAERRDFTCNGLFYDIANFSIIDWVGGLRDIESRTIRTIGDPAVRYREDPVRMLRAIKFAARLRFRIAAEDLDAIRLYRSELLRMSPERLRLELGRLLAAGHAANSFGLLESTGLLEVVAPELLAYLSEQRSSGNPAAAIDLADLKGLDRLVANRREQGITQELPQPVLLGALLSPLVLGAGPAPAPPVTLRLRGMGFAGGLAPWPAPPAVSQFSAAATLDAGGDDGDGTDAEAAPIPGDPVAESGAGDLQTAATADRHHDPSDADESDASLEVAPPPVGDEMEDNGAELAAEEDREGEEALARPVNETRGRPSRANLPVFGGSDPATRVEEVIAPFLVRFTVPRRDAERLVQILAAQHRMRVPGRRDGAHRQLARKEYFPDAIQLFETHVLGTGAGQDELTLWKALESSVRRDPPAARGSSDDGSRPRRRRRGRRRGGQESGDSEPPSSDPRPAMLDSTEHAAVGVELSEAEEARMRQKAEADQMRREQTFHGDRYLPPAKPASFNSRPQFDGPRRARINPAAPPDLSVEASGGAPPAPNRGRRRRRRRSGSGGGDSRGPGAGNPGTGGAGRGGEN